MYKINQIKINASDVYYEDIQSQISYLKKKSAKILGICEEEITDIIIKRRSIDARKSPDIYFTYTVLITLKKNISPKHTPKEVSMYIPKKSLELSTYDKNDRPVVVGFGPAGIACAYMLALKGARPIILERGESIEDRSDTVKSFWEGNKLDENSNVQFGEGGAGAFSDGKLNTSNKDRDGIQSLILEALVRNGAQENILYDAAPHIGTDRLKVVVKNIREHIKSLGGEFYFNTLFTDVELEDNREKKRLVGVYADSKDKTHFFHTNHLILAIGHSSRDTIRNLALHGMQMVAKPFAVGYRVAHPQSMIDASMYKNNYKEKKLPPSPYKLTYRADSGRSVFSFCMCPGGYIVDASSVSGQLCINGMSYSKRDGYFANSAVILGVEPNDFSGDDPLRGMYFQEFIEKRTYELTKGKIAFCTLADALGSVEKNNIDKRNLEYISQGFCGQSEYVSDMISSDLVLPDFLNRDFLEAMTTFGKKISGFNSPDTVIAAVESRTSSPVRMIRGTDYMAESFHGVYVCGEGAGYAGGIMSAAVDGIHTAMSILGGTI